MISDAAPAGYAIRECPMNVNDPIVVTGYAIRLPGGVNSVEDFEQLL